MTRVELGHQVGISRQMIAVVEAGSGNPTLDVVVGLLDGVGVESTSWSVGLARCSRHDSAMRRMPCA